MKAKLEKIVGQLQDLLEEAQELADSENEKTADKYADVPSCIEQAIDSLEEAVGYLES